jgi:hypothetical protein
MFSDLLCPPLQVLNERARRLSFSLKPVNENFQIAIGHGGLPTVNDNVESRREFIVAISNQQDAHSIQGSIVLRHPAFKFRRSVGPINYLRGIGDWGPALGIRE